MYKILRRLSFYVLGRFPLETRQAVDRWLAASHELSKLSKAHGVVLSYPKSGRTWVRAFLSEYYKSLYGLKTERLLGFDNYHDVDGRVPRIYFTHDTYFAARLDDRALVDLLRARHPVLVSRDPRDTVVSGYYQSQYRTVRFKRVIYDRCRAELSDIDNYVRDPTTGLDRVLDFYERWSRRQAPLPDMPVIRYEDLKADSVTGFTRLLEGLGQAPTRESVERAIEASSFERMRAKERSGAYANEGARFGHHGSGRPEAFKVRKGMVGGYRESLKPETVDWMEKRIAERMPPGFGYRADEQVAMVSAVSDHDGQILTSQERLRRISTALSTHDLSP